MTTNRPAASLWARLDRERQLVRNVQEAEWRRRMLAAGHIDADRLSDQARRILAWLAEWDDWTVDGVAELLAAAHHSGLDAARQAPSSGTPGPGGGTEHVAAKSDVPSMPIDAEDRSPEAPPAGDRAGTATTGTGTRPLPTPTGNDLIRARLAALQQRRPESPAVGL